MLRIMAVVGLLFGCGNISVRFITPEPKRLEVGQSAYFVLDASASSNLLKSGDLTMTVVAIDDEKTTIDGFAKVQTIIGAKDFKLVNAIENELLTVDFLDELRTKKTHQAKNTKIAYVGMTKAGCDVVTLSEIKGSDGLTLTPTLCVSSSTIPQVEIKADASGTIVNAVFKAAR